MAKTTYSDKLKDPRWQKKRLEIMERDKFTCQLCGDKETMLNIHHKKYSAKNVWDEPGENLVTICKHCHAIIHADKYPFGNKVRFFEDNLQIFKNVKYIIDDDTIIYDIIISDIYKIEILTLEDYSTHISIVEKAVLCVESYDNIRKSLRDL